MTEPMKICLPAPSKYVKSSTGIKGGKEEVPYDNPTHMLHGHVQYMLQYYATISSIFSSAQVDCRKCKTYIQSEPTILSRTVQRSAYQLLGCATYPT
jgi:hypothetical protein